MDSYSSIKGVKKPRMISKPVNKPLLAIGSDDTDSNNDDITFDSNEEEIIQNKERVKNIREMVRQDEESQEDSEESLVYINGSSLMKMSFTERMDHYENKKKENAVSIAMKVLAEEQADCTFKPKVRDDSRRNLNDFLRDQETFLENKAQKLKSMKIIATEKELKTLQPSPRINARSALMCSGRPRTDRLYKSNTKIKVIKELSPPKPHIKPKGNLLKSRHKSAKRLKNIREENEAFQKKKEEQLAAIKRKVKENFRVQKKLENELDTIFIKNNIANTSISYEDFCTPL